MVFPIDSDTAQHCIFMIIAVDLSNFQFCLQDLFEDDVMVLDSGELVYVWVGDQSTEEERRLAIKMAEVCLSIRSNSA